MHTCDTCTHYSCLERHARRRRKAEKEEWANSIFFVSDLSAHQTPQPPLLLSHSKPLHHPRPSMGRGAAWSSAELYDLAKAWLATSEDPVVGIDQTAGRFAQTLHRHFLLRAPRDPDAKARYESRSAKSAKSKFDQVSADVQKFRRALRIVHASHPTGVVEEQILSMAIAIHLDKIGKMSYDFKDLQHDAWSNHLAYKALCTHPKFHGTQPSSTSQLEDSNGIEAVARASAAGCESTAPTREQTPSRVLVIDDDDEGGTSQSTPNANQRGGLAGRKSEKRAREADNVAKQNSLNGVRIAESLEKKAVLYEEKNAMRAFAMAPCDTEEDKQEKDEYFRMMRKHYLKRARVRLEEGANVNDNQQSNTPSPQPVAVTTPNEPHATDNPSQVSPSPDL